MANHGTKMKGIGWKEKSMWIAKNTVKMTTFY